MSLLKINGKYRVTTGSHDSKALVHKAEAGEIRLLIKPVRFSDLSEAIDGLLQTGAHRPSLVG